MPCIKILSFSSEEVCFLFSRLSQKKKSGGASASPRSLALFFSILSRYIFWGSFSFFVLFHFLFFFRVAAVIVCGLLFSSLSLSLFFFSYYINNNIVYSIYSIIVFFLVENNQKTYNIFRCFSLPVSCLIAPLRRKNKLF